MRRRWKENMERKTMPSSRWTYNQFHARTLRVMSFFHLERRRKKKNVAFLIAFFPAVFWLLQPGRYIIRRVVSRLPPLFCWKNVYVSNACMLNVYCTRQDNELCESFLVGRHVSQTSYIFSYFLFSSRVFVPFFSFCLFLLSISSFLLLIPKGECVHNQRRGDGL